MQQIPHLNSIEGCDAKHELQSDKCFSLQWLCEDICNLIIYFAGYQFNFFVLHMLSDKLSDDMYQCV